MRKIIFSLPVTCSLLLVTFISPALAQTKKFEDVPGAVSDGVATLKGLEVIFFNIVAVSLAAAGIALFVILVIGGFKYLTAGGDQQAVQGARQTLTYAFIGFVVVVAAFLILRFVSVFTGVDVTIFRITQ